MEECWICLFGRGAPPLKSEASPGWVDMVPLCDKQFPLSIKVVFYTVKSKLCPPSSDGEGSAEDLHFDGRYLVL